VSSGIFPAARDQARKTVAKDRRQPLIFAGFVAGNAEILERDQVISG
jgi:hypothetical protein